MKLLLTCRCGSTDFDYTGEDNYRCVECGQLNYTRPIGYATLEVDNPAPQQPVQNIIDRFMRHVSSYIALSGAYNFNINVAERLMHVDVTVFEVSEVGPLGQPNKYLLAVIPSLNHDDVYEIVNDRFDTVATFNIND